MREKICGVYKISNILNGKNYIGISKDCYRRKTSHFSALNRNKHSNSHLQRAWNKYGANAFDFSIIEQCPQSCLEEREVFWITHFDSCNNGYNQSYGADGTVNVVYPEERGVKISKALKGRKYPEHSGAHSPKAKRIICLDTKKQYDCMVDASCDIGIANSAIVRSCKEHIAICDNKYVFAYMDDYLNMTDTEVKNILDFAHKKYGYKKPSSAKPIICLNTEEIFEDGIIASKKTNTDHSYLIKCCKGLVASASKDTTGIGLSWMLLEDYKRASKDEIKARIDRAAKSSKHNIPIPVYCITTNEYFKSCGSAAKKYKINHMSLRHHLDTDGCFGVHPVTDKPLLWKKVG